MYFPYPNHTIGKSRISAIMCFILQLEAVDGVVTLYVSYTARNPGPAIFDIKETVEGRTVNVDISYRNKSHVAGFYPNGSQGADEEGVMTEVFLALQGDGIGARNEYKMSVNEGLHGAGETITAGLTFIIGIILFVMAVVNWQLG